MGYSTRYKLSWEPASGYEDTPNCAHSPSPRAKYCPDCGVAVGRKGLDEAVAEFIAREDEDGGEYAIGYALQSNGNSNGECKWYDHVEDMAEMSREIPHVLFHLEGEGEDSGDIWDLFALDGKTQKHKAKIVRVEKPEPWKR